MVLGTESEDSGSGTDIRFLRAVRSWTGGCHGGRVRAASDRGTDRGRIQSGEGLLITRRGTGRRTVGLKGGAGSSATDESGL